MSKTPILKSLLEETVFFILLKSWVHGNTVLARTLTVAAT